MAVSKERLALLKKLEKLQDVMGSFAWEKDGINHHQRYKYVTEKQYKQNFKKALKEAGLLWKMDTIKVTLHPNITDKMNMVEAQFIGTLTDPDTGECEEYFFCGTGADAGDKGLYKAVTGGHKYFLSANFNVSEDNDPESDVDELPRVSPPASPEKREELKQELTDEEGKATKMQIKALKKSLAMLREIDPAQEKFIGEVAIRTEGFKNISKKSCETLLVKVAEMIDEAKKGAGK